MNDSTDQIEHDNESHTETAESAQPFDGEKDEEIVNGRVNPSSSLGEENRPCIWGSRPCTCVTNKLRLESVVVFQEETKLVRSREGVRCEITIFTKEEQVLGVEIIDPVLRVIVDNL